MKEGLAIWRAVAMWLVVAALAGCGRGESPEAAATSTAPAAPAALADVTLPDLSALEASVAEQARERHAAVTQKRANAQTRPEELGRAYGELGMLMHAGEYFDVAETAYLNAEALQPREMRWPYYLGHVYIREGESAKAIDAFTRALALSPNDVPALVRLGRLYLEQGEPDKADPLFTKAASIPPRSLPAVAGLGQVALARRDYGRAAQLLEEALTIDPRAASLHSPLALAYRGLGDHARAEAHTKQWKNTEVAIVDPLFEALSVSLDSGLSYELRGVSALETREFDRAADLFRKGVALAPGTTALGRSLRHKLGTALALTGDIEGAVAQFEDVVRFAPPGALDEPAAKAHYSLGVLNAGAGRQQDAVRHLTASVQFDPNYLEAQVALGDVLRRAGQVEASLGPYGEAVRLSATAAEARFGYAMALVKLRRYVEARDWLAESVRVQPDRPELTHALARLLATAPDAAARDGQRALTLTKQLAATHNTVDVGETMAMALAELGQFGDAVAIQRQVIEAARKGGTAGDVRRMNANLRLYEQGQPCRTPWPDDHPVHFPGPQGAPE